MKFQVKIPKGWRQIVAGRKVYKWDRYWDDWRGLWVVLDHREDVYYPVGDDEIIIRRIKKAKEKP
jgi:hypothetical protein